jgi:RP/EB family microtubule-associated protein
MSNQKIGMMDEAYFVGKKQVLEWINSLLDVNLPKIEDTCSGAIACQLFHSMYPTSLAMTKVNWDAKNEYEYLKNYKLLQTGFAKRHITKIIEVDRLSRGKYQDNLEFMQWFKRFHELNSPEDLEYDGLSFRSKGKGGEKYKYNQTAGAAGAAPRSVTSALKNSSISKAVRSRAPTGRAPSPQNSARGAEQAEEARVATLLAETLKVRNEELLDSNGELRASVDELEKERDFYFGKLRSIEQMLQEAEGNNLELSKPIFKILYQTADGEGGEPQAVQEDAKAPSVVASKGPFVDAVHEEEDGEFLQQVDGDDEY